MLCTYRFFLIECPEIAIIYIKKVAFFDLKKKIKRLFSNNSYL